MMLDPIKKKKEEKTGKLEENLLSLYNKAIF